MPRLHSEDEELLLKLPNNFQEAQAVKATLALYKENCSGHVIALLICLYLFMQVQFTLCMLDGIHSLSVAEQSVMHVHSVRPCRRVTSYAHALRFFPNDNNITLTACYSPAACIYYGLCTVSHDGCCASKTKQAMSLWMQVFMIPGAMFINVLAGSLYGLWGTFCVIACVSTLGAGLNYWLARLLVRVTLCSGCLHICQY